MVVVESDVVISISSKSVVPTDVVIDDSVVYDVNVVGRLVDAADVNVSIDVADSVVCDVVRGIVVGRLVPNDVVRVSIDVVPGGSLINTFVVGNITAGDVIVLNNVVNGDSVVRDVVNRFVVGRLVVAADVKVSIVVADSVIRDLVRVIVVVRLVPKDVVRVSIDDVPGGSVVANTFVVAGDVVIVFNNVVDGDSVVRDVVNKFVVVVGRLVVKYVVIISMSVVVGDSVVIDVVG